MSSELTPPLGLHRVTSSPVDGLAMAERRVDRPRASIVCVHGGLDRGGSFARLARRTDDFDLVTYDRRGYQGSRALGPLGLAHHVDDLLAVARSEAARGPVILFGHSYGGVVALGAMVAEPSLAQLGILYESPMPWVLQRESARAPLTSDPALEAEQFFRRMVSNSAWERLSDVEKDARRLDGPALLSDLTSLHGGDEVLDVAQLKVPTYYLYGDADVARRDYYRALCAKLTAMNGAIRSREIAGAGHGAHLSKPDHLAALIASLWASVCA